MSFYDPVFAEQVAKLCKLGAKESELADFFNVSLKVFQGWKKDYPEFNDAVKSGMLIADSEVANSLYRLAIGFEYQDVIIGSRQGHVTIEYVTRTKLPDPRSCIFWLERRRPDEWAAKTHKTKELPAKTKEAPNILETARQIAFMLKQGERELAKADAVEITDVIDSVSSAVSH